MKQQQYIKSLEDAFEIYGRENLVPISFIKQQIFLARMGCQPRFIWEKEDSPGKIVAWYLKAEFIALKSAWEKTKPNKI